MTLTLKIVIGSTRPGRKGPLVADWVAEQARAHGAFDVQVVDLADIDLPLLDEAEHPMKKAYAHDHTKTWSAIIDEADAVIFVSPEYDFFAPASLVNAVQTLMQEWRYKAAALVTYGGVSGGLRAAQVMRGLLGNVGVMAIPQGVMLPLFATHIQDDRFQPPAIAADSAGVMLGELAKWAGALKPIRG
ncbi:MAG: NAD(P)H-dependent oxidoreductase [Rhodobacter sp.]|nr:NAD(P)H-dependent oxidoreductase [Paracoccaceae bacterium]MCC0080840.1 NAD(P)H-dependent oxidoreductase [Rhodobacter sp.]